MNKWKNRLKELDWREAAFLIVCYIISIVSLLHMSSNILGPVIGGDEMLYFNIARNFFKTGAIYSTQYNPLYPILCSPFFMQEDLIIVFKMIKIFNVCSFSSVIFPIFFTCKILIKDKYWWYILSGMSVFFPWKLTVNLIWAEPLYYPLYAWGIFFFCVYLKSRENRFLIFSGIFSGACFMTKQAGLLLIAPIGLIILFLCWSERESLKESVRKVLCFSIPAGCFVFPLMIYNKLINGGALGYAGEIDNIKNNFFNLIDFVPTFMLDFSYYILATGFVILVLALYLMLSMNKLDDMSKAFGLVISISVFLIMILCAFHYVELRACYGRYLTVAIPFIYIMAVMALEQLELNRAILIIMNVICLGLALVFNPFWNTMHAKGYVNQQDLSVWNLFFMEETLTYSAEDAKKFMVNDNVHYYFIIAMFCISLLVIIMIRSKLIQRASITLFMLCIVLLSFPANQTLTGRVMASGNPMNSLYRYLLKENIPVEKVYKVSSAIGNKDCEDVWFEEEIAVMDFSTLRYGQNLFLDFGGGSTPVAEGAYAIKAPWEVGSFYDGMNITIGLDFKQSIVDVSSTTGYLYSETAQNDGMDDAIYGVDDNTIYIEKPEGKYKVQIKSAPNLIIESMELAYEVYANGKYVGEINSEQTEIEFEVKLKETEDSTEKQIIEVEVKPINGGYWQIAVMNILCDDKNLIDNRGIYIITSKEQVCDLPVVYKNDRYMVFYKE